jgi:ubiquinone/menaquinone biosynthesis C-methylase UbiE
MPHTPEHSHQDKIRERFTRTAQPFSQFVLAKRSEEAEHLADLGMADFSTARDAVAVDIGCGPGTLARVFARRLNRVLGVDLTPAMLIQARQAASEAALANLSFLCADANALPFADASIDMVTCGYAFHHLPRPEHVLAEMARVLRSQGRVVAVDLVVPPHADSEAHNRIERVRDASHATTLRAPALRELFETAGLHVRFSEQRERQRNFDDWMMVAGWAPSTGIYAETRLLMEHSVAGDTAGFRPNTDVTGQWQFVQTSLYLVAEKP